MIVTMMMIVRIMMVITTMMTLNYHFYLLQIQAIINHNFQWLTIRSNRHIIFIKAWLDY